jgi:hypothetical protein
MTLLVKADILVRAKWLFQNALMSDLSVDGCSEIYCHV